MYSVEKLDPRALECILLSYSPTQKGFNYFHSPTKKIFVFMDVKFFENLSYYAEIDIQGKKYWMEDSSFPNQ